MTDHAQQSPDLETAGSPINPAGTVRSPDPGSRRLSIAAWALVVVFIGLVVVINQFEGNATPTSPGAAAAVQAPQFDPFTISAKLVVKLAHGGLPIDPGSQVLLLRNIDEAAQTPVEKFRGAIAAADVAGAEAGIKRLEDESLAVPELAEDVTSLRTILTDGPDAVAADQRERLLDRHGWFGRLALTFGKADTDPERAPLLTGGGGLIALGVGVIMVVGLAFVGWMGATITLILLASGGKLRRRFVAPLPGGSIMLEMVAVFVGAFLIFKVGFPYLIDVVSGPGPAPQWAAAASLVGQWTLVLALFWPVVRGVPFHQARALLGWTSGRGVLRELGAGLVGYLAGLPLLVGAAIITIVIVMVRQAMQKASGEPVTTPDNPIFDFVSKGSPLGLFLLFTLATLWAPLVEESVFRGAFYRHLRSRLHFVFAAIVSAVAFGVMHGYDFLLLLPVMSLGVTFALMREWRGSLIAPMFAHCLHNATILTLVLTALSILKD